MSKYLLHIFSIAIIATLLLGCGGGSSDILTENDNDLYNSVTVTVSGTVIDGTTNSTRTSEVRYSLNNDLSGILVYMEGRRELCATTDINGKFIISKVPVGTRSFIAEKKEMGVIAYRQRLASINIKNSKDTVELSTPITIVSAPYSNNYVVKDPVSGKPIAFAKAIIWDTEYVSDSNGNLSITNFPATTDASVTITANGYRPFTTKISFDENIKATSDINMTKTSGNNLFPVVSIKYENTSAIYENQGRLTLEPNTYISLEADGYDPDDLKSALTWNWSATDGKFNGNTSSKTIMYMAPTNCDKVIITLRGKDQQKSSSSAAIEFYVNNQKSQDENQPPYPITNISPANNAKDVLTSQSLVFKWYCLGDPNPDDTVTYNVYLKSKDSDFASIGKTTNQQLTYSSNINENTEYSWYVTATDNSGLTTKGETWKFTTENLEGITFITPTKVTEPLKLQFAKSVDVNKTDFSNLDTFSPVMNATCKWSNNNKTAELLPASGAWYTGSYNVIMIHPERIVFSDGKKNATNIIKSFELPSEIPIPEGYRSCAFPMNLKANEYSGIVIPSLKKGKNSYALIMNYCEDIYNGRLDAASGNLDNVIKDTTYQYRQQEIELQNRQVPDIVLHGKTMSARAALKSHELYEQRKFIVNTGESDQNITTLLVAFNDKALIYADINIQATKENEIRINNLLEKFSEANGIHETNEQYFGKAPQYGPDGEDRLAIVLYEPTCDTSTCGYFTAIDFYNQDLKDPALCLSNACKAVYLNFAMDDTNIKATLAHEFQHLIYFYHKGMAKFEDNNYRLSKEDIWLNEGMAKIAEEINGFDINNNHNTASWILGSQKEISKLSLTNWDGNTYGIAYLFMRYLTQPGRYKATDKEVTRAIIASGRQESTKDIEKITNEPFKNTLAKWALSLYINNWNSTDPKAYGIYGINLKGCYCGYQFYGFPIYNISVGQTIGPFSMPKNGFACVRAPSAGDTSLTAIAFASEQPTSVYFFDERDY